MQFFPVTGVARLNTYTLYIIVWMLLKVHHKTIPMYTQYILFFSTFLWIFHTRLTTCETRKTASPHFIYYDSIRLEVYVVVLNLSSYYFRDDLSSDYLSFKLKMVLLYKSYYLYFIAWSKNRPWQRVALKIHAQLWHYNIDDWTISEIR